MDTPPKRWNEYAPPVHRLLPLPQLALASMVSKDGMAVYASSDTLYRGAVFGRDSLEVADDLLEFKPALVHNLLLSMGRLQGVRDNILNEEQPGKIIHEYRTTMLNGKPIDKKSLDIFRQLAAKWGGSDSELAYYGSIDATPHYLRTLGNYCERYGESILDKDVVQRDGKRVTIRQTAAAAAHWLVTEMSASNSGMLEYKMVHPLGTPNQAWKDSEESYVHENGEMANHNSPIASIEVQGLTYDALMSAAKFFPKSTKKYTAMAHNVRDTTIETLWQPGSGYFALGTDYDPDNGGIRVIATVMANAGALLDTNIFSSLETTKRQQYISGIVERVMAKDFLTSAGVRSRSLTMSHVVPFWDYHGSYVTWPKETYDIAKGLRRQGFPRLSRQLENRLLNLVLKTREYPEFVYVDGWGRVLAGPPYPSQRKIKSIPAEGNDKPEHTQAWTVSALMAIVSSRGRAKLKRKSPHTQESWQKDLENHVMDRIPHVDLHLNPVKLWLQYPTHSYHLTHPKK